MIKDHDKRPPAGEPLHDEGAGPILMESGSIRPDGDGCGESQVSRGMPAISADGREVGWVAAVALDAAGNSTGVVIARPHTTLEYYHLPLDLIGGISDGHVRLRIQAEAAWSLRRRNASPTSESKRRRMR